MTFATLLAGIATVLSALKGTFNLLHTGISTVGAVSGSFLPDLLKAVLIGVTVAGSVAHITSIGLAALSGGLVSLGSFLTRMTTPVTS